MAAFARSLRPLLSAATSAIRQQRCNNPVQLVFGKDAIRARGLATVFERSKPHVNIGIEAEIENEGIN